MDLPLSFRIMFCVPSFLWAAYFFRRATRQGRFIAIAFVVMATYGFLIEYYDIRSSHSYDYARMLVMLADWPLWVPLSVCLSWAVILLIASSLSDRLGLPWYQRPLVDGLFATLLDMAGDPVFSNTRYVESLARSCADATSSAFGGIGVWTWCVPEGIPLWFTVPLGNFFGWFLVIALFSFLLRFAQVKLNATNRPWFVQLGMLVVVAALSAVVVELALRAFTLLPARLTVFVLAATLLLPVVLIVRHRRQLNFNNPFDLGLVLMPLTGNASDVYIYFHYSIDKNMGSTWAALLVLTALASTAITLLPFAGTLLRRRPAV